MQLTLRCTSHQGIDDIVINDTVFIIGRSKAPYTQYHKTMTAALSRHHAKIYKTNGKVFLEDLGSRNGTTLNGEKIDRSANEIGAGDVLSIAGEIIYEIYLDQSEAANQANAEADFRLVLELPKKTGEVESIAVTTFPFFIGKKQGVFKKLALVDDDATCFMSREHACVLRVGDALYLQDVGSTNGTYHNDERLDQDKVSLTSGDKIAFGDKTSLFTVKILIKQEEEAGTIDQAQVNADPQHTLSQTIFMTKADFFLEAFCANQRVGSEGDEVDDTGGLGSENEDAEELKHTEKPKKLVATKHKAFVFMKEFHEAFSDEKRHSNPSKWLTAAVIFVITMAGFGWYYKGSTEKTIQALLAKGEYEQSAELANQYLSYHEGNTQVSTLSTQASLQYGLTPWIALIDKRDFTAAQNVLTKMRQLSDNNGNRSRDDRVV